MSSDSFYNVGGETYRDNTGFLATIFPNFSVKKFFSRRVIVFLITLMCGINSTDVSDAFADNSDIVPVQIIAINDLHGNLLPPIGSSGNIRWRNSSGRIENISAGGAAQLAYDIHQVEKGQKNSIIVGAGDLIGASPLVSAMFQDEPTIDVLNSLGLKVSSVGNHEFDEGLQELLRIQRGGCYHQTECFGNKKFTGAHFLYLAANVFPTSSFQSVLPPYWIWKQGPIKIGFIGLPLQGVPSVSTIRGTQGLRFTAEVPIINHYTQVLQSQGVHAIFVLIHQGSMSKLAADNDTCTDPNSQLSGPIQGIAEHINPAVDAIISAHSHQAYICYIPDPAGHKRLVTQASSFGRLFTDFTFPYNIHTGSIDRSQIKAVQHMVRASDPSDPEIAQEIAQWEKLIAPVATKIVGYSTSNISEHEGDLGHQAPLGEIIADAQEDAMKSKGSEIALTNSGGIRSDLVSTNGRILFNAVFTSQPFRNVLYMVNLSGKQILQALEQQVTGINAKDPRFLQVSAGLHYRLNHVSGQSLSVDVDSVRINGQPLNLKRIYHVTLNEFLVDGGDGYTALGEGTHRIAGPFDDDALVQYLESHSSANHPLTIPALDRVSES